MEFYHHFLSVTFVVLTVDQFVGRDDACLNNRGSIALRLLKKSHNSFEGHHYKDDEV